MKIVVFGLTISSSWGNGHATLWRGLCNALARRHCRIVFFERDVPYYARERDFYDVPCGRLVLYRDWPTIAAAAANELRDADVAIVTSYCPDGVAATELVTAHCRVLKLFYDLDTPVTLTALSSGAQLPYIGDRGLRDFDLVLSYTGGEALAALRSQLGAPRVAALYGHVDPELHRPAAALPHYRSDLSYLGTYSADRQAALEELLLAPARRRPPCRFLIGGAQYPQDFPWTSNLYFVRHLPPQEHAAFFSSSRLTLNLTRAAMARMGWCPSGRLFEAAACGAPVITDAWEGLEAFFTPGAEILLARSADDVIGALDLTDAELARIAIGGRERTLAQHTSERRADELLTIFEQARAPAARQLAEA